MSAWFDEVRALTEQLVRWPSVTNSPGETRFGQQLHDLLAAMPYFEQHPEHLRLERTTDDLHERFSLFALVKGRGAHTVALTGHYDVVEIGNYGALAPWAFDPPELLPRLIAALEADAHSDGDRLALAELQTGDFMVGRGALDMKSGIAAGIAVLRRFAAAPEREGNLLLIATPDEEEASHGIRAAMRRLPELAAAWQLDVAAALNLDSSGERGDEGAGRAIFLGSVGKLLPAVLLVGRPAHAGAPFDGVNPNLLAAELTRRVECNVELADSGPDGAAPPPVSLKQTDLKHHYDVTMPHAAWCYFNVLTHRRSAADVLEQMGELARAALDDALAYLRQQAVRYAALTGQPAPEQPWQPRVLSFGELAAHVRSRLDPAANQRLDAEFAALAADPTLDAPQLSQRIVEQLWWHSGLAGPAAVVGVGSLYYPPAFVAEDSERERRLREAAATQALAVGAESGHEITLRGFFPGISDMSFVGGHPSAADIAVIQRNTPA
jgi:arginine utilization protein RocB